MFIFQFGVQDSCNQSSCEQQVVRNVLGSFSGSQQLFQNRIDDSSATGCFGLGCNGTELRLVKIRGRNQFCYRGFCVVLVSHFQVGRQGQRQRIDVGELELQGLRAQFQDTCEIFQLAGAQGNGIETFANVIRIAIRLFGGDQICAKP
jgi:hypothetical protein